MGAPVTTFHHRFRGIYPQMIPEICKKKDHLFSKNIGALSVLAP